MTIAMHQQTMSRAAFQCVEARLHSDASAEYLSFARGFPTLIHTCGLAQAAAFALAKKKEKLCVLDDVASVVNAIDATWQINDGASLDMQARMNRDVNDYIRLTRQALRAAGCIKRYAEALLDADSIPANADGVLT